jgi:hypothetical protein
MIIWQGSSPLAREKEVLLTNSDPVIPVCLFI